MNNRKADYKKPAPSTNIGIADFSADETAKIVQNIYFVETFYYKGLIICICSCAAFLGTLFLNSYFWCLISESVSEEKVANIIKTLSKIFKIAINTHVFFSKT